MTRRFSRKDMKHDEFVDTAVEAGHWIEKNWQAAVKGVAAVVLLGALVLVWFWYAGQSREKAAELLADGIHLYQLSAKDGFTEAEDVVEALTLFEEAADKAGNSPAGMSARYYQGAALLRLGRAEEAVAALEGLSTSKATPTLASGTKVLLAEALVATDQADRGIDLLQEVADDSASSFPPDQALLLMARVRQGQGNDDEARRIWQRIAEEYPQSAGAAEANRLLATP